MYNDNKFKPLHIMLSKTCKNVWCTNWMDVFLIEDDDLLEKCNAVWDEVSADIKK